ncbi:endonuclease III [Microvirga mediterraneensis]|uniref:Endonuclease III n=1 Tax=Microvirga mediterraneensis TaxID=2754695 RepID=A0A838BKQ5_9HYPH|nr:endonuclease III [Microvirga mediterraneensis]MBA1155881.1 endonuclease III [Microvirga mediterraneensis]
MSDLKPSPRRIAKANSSSKSKPAVPAKTVGKAIRARRPKPVDRATMVEVFRRLHAANPEPKGELDYTNPYTLLVAVALSAQSTDVGVNKATRNLFPVADTPQKMLDLGEEGLREHIRTLNFYNTKAKNVIAAARRLVDEFGGKVPNSVEVLETLPGVGRKTASVVVNIAFKDPRIAVDTHIFRVTNRIPLAITRTPLETQVALEALIPDEFRLHAHHWLILHGRYICKARRPECWRCPINDLCRYPDKTIP